MLYTEVMTYARYLQDLVPTWLRANYGGAWLGAHGDELDRLLELFKNSVKARFLDTAPEDALTLLGVDRAIERFPNENVNAYLSRLRGVWDFWRLAGTKQGMKLALTYAGYAGRTATFGADGENFVIVTTAGFSDDNTIMIRLIDGAVISSGTTTLFFGGASWVLDTFEISGDAEYYIGYPSQIIEHYESEPAAWSEFSVVLYPDQTSFTGWQYGTGAWGDGRVWGLDLTTNEANRVREIIQRVKPAHTKLRELRYVKGGLVWGTFAYGIGSSYGGDVVLL